MRIIDILEEDRDLQKIGLGYPGVFCTSEILGHTDKLGVIYFSKSSKVFEERYSSLELYRLSQEEYLLVKILLKLLGQHINLDLKDNKYYCSAFYHTTNSPPAQHLDRDELHWFFHLYSQESPEDISVYFFDPKTLEFKDMSYEQYIEITNGNSI